MAHQDDPRSRNVVFSTQTAHDYLGSYLDELGRAVRQVDAKALARAISVVEAAAAGKKHVYGIGNGGSAAIVDHLCCDWTKGTAHAAHASIKTHSLVANSALLLAAANDFGFENSFSKQIEFYAEQGDVLIAISSSGNSPNIINAVELAKSRGVTVIGMSGFAGGKLRDMSDIALFVPCSNYGIVEDGHQILMHTIAQVIANKRDGRA